MKILIINKFSKGEVKDSDILPRIGDSIDMFYIPFPVVKSVLLWPSEASLDTPDKKGVQAIITVE